MKNWVVGKKVERLPAEMELRSQMMKTKFLFNLGFVENSSEMIRALRLFRGKALNLPERIILHKSNAPVLVLLLTKHHYISKSSKDLTSDTFKANPIKHADMQNGAKIDINAGD
ncbi:hypothetical protein ACH5RR_006487 [Cinchona calisaya]|uniref:Ribosomal protein L30 n=1 Tax=Cinchona calisaya TaxID=153742 RepID=A0ABD3AP47_9GENT